MSRRRPAAPSLPAGRARAGLRASAVVAAVVALAGCSVTNPMLTTLDYEASDGLDLDVGDVEGTNLLVLSAEEGAPGRLVGGLSNRGDDDTTVELVLLDAEGAAGDPVRVELDAGTTVSFAGATGETIPDDEVLFDQVPVPPGSIVQLQMRVSSGEIGSRGVPVLDDSLPPYDQYVPEGGATAG